MKKISQAEFEASRLNTRNSSNSADVFKSFLKQNYIAIKKDFGTEFTLESGDIQKIFGSKDIHYYGIYKALHQTNKKGQVNKEFDPELAALVDVVFTAEGKEDNARVSSFNVRLLK